MLVFDPRSDRAETLIEYLAPSFVYAVVKDLWFLIKRGRRRPTATEVIAARQKWKPIFEDKIAERRRDKLNTDIIVHDVKRLDQYPNGPEGKGISSWFRVGLMGTYHGGILVGLRWETLNKLADDSGWRITDYAADEKGDVRVILLGEIPYERIEGVDWDGDQYYGFPHVYCHFDGPGGSLINASYTASSGSWTSFRSTWTWRRKSPFVTPTRSIELLAI